MPMLEAAPQTTPKAPIALRCKNGVRDPPPGAAERNRGMRDPDPPDRAQAKPSTGGSRTVELNRGSSDRG
jgi:hypothetical protein